MNFLFDKFFWFVQPSTFLSETDKLFIYIFAAMVIGAIILRLAARFLTKNPVTKKMLMKFWSWGFVIGTSGILWGAMRYENTYILGRRYWAGINFVVGFVWLILILKYLAFSYRREKIEFDRESIKSKYLPKSR
jgi:hypothetical protein